MGFYDFDFDGGSSYDDVDTHPSGNEKVFEGEGYMAAKKEGVSGQFPEKTIPSGSFVEGCSG